MFNGVSDYLLGKVIGASIGFVLVSLIFVPVTLKEGLVRFAFFICSVAIFTSPVLNYFNHSGVEALDVASAAGIAGVTAWIFAALAQILSGYSLTEIAEIASIVKSGKGGRR